MNAESKKIHEEYEELFGKAKRVNLFDTDEENEILHQFILAQLCTVNSCSHQILFDEQKVETYRADAFNKVVNEVITQGYHVFWLRTLQKKCDAAGYYDDKNKYFFHSYSGYLKSLYAFVLILLLQTITDAKKYITLA